MLTPTLQTVQKKLNYAFKVMVQTFNLTPPDGAGWGRAQAPPLPVPIWDRSGRNDAPIKIHPGQSAAARGGTKPRQVVTLSRGACTAVCF